MKNGCLGREVRDFHEKNGYVQLNVSSVCNPDLFATPMQPLSPLRMKWSLSNFLGKKNNDGRAFHKVFTATATVIISPRSAEVPDPTCFVPVRPALLCALRTVETPVSSIS